MTAVTVTDRSALAAALRNLKLSGMLATLDARLAQAHAGELGHLCRTGRADRGGARGGNRPGCFPVARSRAVACVLAMMARFRRGG